MFFLKKIFVALTALLFIVSAIVSAEQTQKISQQQLLSMQHAPSAPAFIVLDVRSAEEFSLGHIPNAINISHDEITEQLTKLDKYKNTLVVVHCRSGRRAVSAETTLKNNGFTKLRHLTGDMNAWQANNFDIVIE